MSLFQLLEEDPGMFVLVLLISLVLTVVVYGAFPVIFAKTRSAPITKKKYLWLCFGINIIGFVLFTIFDGGASAAPYFLWTYVFSNYGKKELESKGLLLDASQKSEEPKIDHTTQNIVSPRESTPTPTNTVANPHRTASPTVPKASISFCRKCGNRLTSGSVFCNKCGSKISWN